MAQVNLDTAARLDIVCRKGDSFVLTVDFGTGVPRTGEEGAANDSKWDMDVKSSDASDATSILADTVFSYNTTVENKITIEASASEMASVTPGLYVYDLQNTDADTTVDGDSKVTTYLYGTFKVNADITTV